LTRSLRARSLADDGKGNVQFGFHIKDPDGVVVQIV
jgi:hypothetical protein